LTILGGETTTFEEKEKGKEKCIRCKTKPSESPRNGRKSLKIVYFDAFFIVTNTKPASHKKGCGP